MKAKISMILCAALALVACGDDDDVVEQEPLPQNPQLFVVPVIVNFPVTRNGQTSTQSVTLTNGGQNALDVSDVTITGPDADAFTLAEGTTVPLSIDSRGAASIEIDFAASTTDGDIRRAQLTIESNAENFASTTLELVGPAIPEAGSGAVLGPRIAATDDPVTPAAAAPQLAVVGYFNLGDESLVVTEYSIADPTVFNFSTNPAFTPVLPGASCSMNGEADCDGDPNTSSDDADLFCFNSGTPGTEMADRMDDVCAISVPALGSIAFQLDVLSSGSTDLTIRSNDSTTPALTISLEN
ncbi:MAG: choice-of-anchor D domain-containing protein [Myxococcota bacterium]